MKRWILVFTCWISFALFAQDRTKTSTLSFGFQYKPIIPANIFGSGKFSMDDGPFRGTVAPKFGNSFGGIIRVQFTKLIAIETGINYVRRDFNLNWDVPDSNLAEKGDVGIVNYDIPLNLLIFVRLTDKFYMNASMGLSMMMFASDVRVGQSIGLNENFTFEGRRRGWFQGGLNTNVGFEYRMKKSGSIYLGASFKLPFTPIMNVAMDYEKSSKKYVGFGELKGAYLTLDIRYFFKPMVIKRGKKKKSERPKELGPIEQ